MHNSKINRLASAMAAVGLITCGNAHALEFDFYGSLRFHAEAVSPDNDNVLDSYTGWRDAYSRLGFKAHHALNDNLNAYAQLELPLDLPNKAVQDPWDQGQDIRIAKVGIKGAFGNLSIGQMWLPYYNAIAYPVDMFSSYYSGFATFTSFRKGDTIAYYSPSFSGFSGALGYSLEHGALKANGDSDDRLQATLSYSLDEMTLAAGVDDLGGIYDSRIFGASLSWQAMKDLSIGAKYEVHDSKIDNGYGADGDTAVNLYAGYSQGKNTYKIMLANVDNYGEGILHLGWDHQYRDDLKFFVEFYREEETAAITEKYGGLDETCWSCSGGHVIAAGLRYDFSSQ
jgi:predicted porin